MVTKYIDWEEYQNDVEIISWEIKNSAFSPNYILGITRGGACLATSLSHRLGHIPVIYFDPKRQKLNDFNINWSKDKVLITDDINDTGSTLIQVTKSIITTLHPEIRVIDAKIFSLDNVRFCVLFENLSSPFRTNFYSQNINKSKEDIWVVFPWEKTEKNIY